jgi:hemoglobin-like flavoprotein
MCPPQIAINLKHQEITMSIMSKLRGFFSNGQGNGTAPPSAAPTPAAKTEGPLSARQIEMVQSTWQQVVPIADQAASLFYGRLFELDPNLKILFANTEMQEQQKKLMQMITVAVNGLDHLDQIVPAVQELGRRHVGYGVHDGHYPTVATALLWTLERGLGEAFTPEVQEAWTVTYTILADTMKGAAAEMTVHEV